MHPVTVLATKDDAGKVHFAPESDVWNHSDEEFVFHKDKHDMRKHDYHLVEFVLDDRTGEGLRFPTSPHDAMWVAAVEDPAHPKCPDAETESDYEVLEPICVCDHHQRLIVRNHNPRQELWSFTLNFVKEGADEKDKSAYVNWDPVTNNQNGGTGN
jgi:hypothetical protein